MYFQRGFVIWVLHRTLIKDLLTKGLLIPVENSLPTSVFQDLFFPKLIWIFKGPGVILQHFQDNPGRGNKQRHLSIHGSHSGNVSRVNLCVNCS